MDIKITKNFIRTVILAVNLSVMGMESSTTSRRSQLSFQQLIKSPLPLKQFTLTAEQARIVQEGREWQQDLNDTVASVNKKYEEIDREFGYQTLRRAMDLVAIEVASKEYSENITRLNREFNNAA